MRDQNELIECLVVHPFYEDREYQPGEVVMMTREQATRFGGAGLVRSNVEEWQPLPENVKVTVIVLLYKTEFQEFHRWAMSLLNSHSKGKASLGVTVVENTGDDYPDKEKNLAFAAGLGFKVVVAPKNLGFAKGVNAGARVSDGDIFVFLNDDMEFREAGFIDTLIEPLRTNQKAAVCGADLQRMDGGDWRAYDRPNWVCGACFAVRGFDFLRFGGFDERYFFSWEETDYCEMVNRLGYTIHKTAAKAWHVGGETADLVSDFARHHFEQGSAIYREKWGFDGQGSGTRIVGSMIVHNEKGRYLEESLAWLLAHCIRVVILDDASDDGTWQLLQEWEARYPKQIALYRNETGMFRKDEHLAREWLHYKALKEAPHWIIPLDADEELSKRYDAKLEELLRIGKACDFPIVHYWRDPWHRRVDGFWGKQSNVRFYPVRWDKRQNFYFQPLHCGSAPVYAYIEKELVPDVALLHKGWMKTCDFETKKKRNIELDPSGYWEPQEHLTTDNLVMANFEDDGKPGRDFRETPSKDMPTL